MTIRQTVLRLSDVFDFCSRILIVPAVAAFVLIIFASVVGRYVLHVAIYASGEISRITFIWSAFLGAALGVKRKAHISLTFLADKLPLGARNTVGRLMSVLSIVFFGCASVMGLQLALALRVSYFPVLGIPEFWLFLAFPVSCVFITVHLMAQILSGEPPR